MTSRHFPPKNPKQTTWLQNGHVSPKGFVESPHQAWAPKSLAPRAAFEAENQWSDAVKIWGKLYISHLGERKIIFKYAILEGYVSSLEGNISITKPTEVGPYDRCKWSEIGAPVSIRVITNPSYIPVYFRPFMVNYTPGSTNIAGWKFPHECRCREPTGIGGGFLLRPVSLPEGIIFHQPRFPWNNGNFPYFSPPEWDFLQKHTGNWTDCWSLKFGDHLLRLWVSLPLFTTGFSSILGGWPWDFWTNNGMKLIFVGR